jgi:hypothetical protein
MTLGLLGRLDIDCESFVSDRRLSDDCFFCITGNSSGVYIGISSSLKNPAKPSASASTTPADVSDKTTGSGVAGRVLGFLDEKASSKMRSNSSQEMMGLSRGERNIVMAWGYVQIDGICYYRSSAEGSGTCAAGTLYLPCLVAPCRHPQDPREPARD